ncbi:MAG: hypothetical protein E7055_05370 [Lentisphaerae bacterium]|nr:hypothetical protein [Lentisphaerota bacterium]
MISMNKAMMSAFAAVLSMVSVCGAEKKPAAPVFKGSRYECMIFDRYRKDSGIMKLSSCGKTLFFGDKVYAACKGTDGKQISLAEQSDVQYKWKGNVLSNEKLLCVRNAQAESKEAFAKIKRKIRFSPDRIDIEITVTNLQDLTWAQTWLVCTETLAVVTKSVAGMHISGTMIDNQPINSIIPKKFDKSKWGFNKIVKNMNLTDSEQFSMTVTALPNSLLSFVNYGGTYCDLKVFPNIKPIELKQKAGQETKFGCTIEFGKPE